MPFPYLDQRLRTSPDELDDSNAFERSKGRINGSPTELSSFGKLT